MKTHHENTINHKTHMKMDQTSFFGAVAAPFEDEDLFTLLGAAGG